MMSVHEEWLRYLEFLDQDQRAVAETMAKEIENNGVYDRVLERVRVSTRAAIMSANQKTFAPVRKLEAYKWNIDWGWVEGNIDGFCVPAEDEEDPAAF